MSSTTQAERERELVRRERGRGRGDREDARGDRDGDRQHVVGEQRGGGDEAGQRAEVLAWRRRTSRRSSRRRGRVWRYESTTIASSAEIADRDRQHEVQATRPPSARPARRAPPRSRRRPTRAGRTRRSAARALREQRVLELAAGSRTADQHALRACDKGRGGQLRSRPHHEHPAPRVLENVVDRPCRRVPCPAGGARAGRRSGRRRPLIGARRRLRSPRALARTTCDRSRTPRLAAIAFAFHPEGTASPAASSLAMCASSGELGRDLDHERPPSMAAPASARARAARATPSSASSSSTERGTTIRR